MAKTPAKKAATSVDDLLDDAMADLKKAAEEVGGKAEETLARAAATLSKAAKTVASEAKTKVPAMAKTAVKEVKAHPKTATAVAVGAALLVALLATRRKSDD
jgi:ElaB/YqjD/DUF883 family membrane-anchored ribosome-binding protein